jgi:hypothetical protein
MHNQSNMTRTTYYATMIRRGRYFNSSPATSALLERAIQKQKRKDVLAEPSSTFQEAQGDFDSFPVIEWQDDAEVPDYNLSPCTQKSTISLKHLANPKGEVSPHRIFRSTKIKSSLSLLADDISQPNSPSMPFGNLVDRRLFPLDIQGEMHRNFTLARRKKAETILSIPT